MKINPGNFKMKTKSLLIFFIIISCSLQVFSQTDDKKLIENVIIKSYIHGLIDGENFQEAKKGIHENFVIWGRRDSLLTQKTRDEWIEQRKKRGNLKKVDYTIIYIDIEGSAANAKIKLTRGNLLATDYLFLYKFNNSWKIVSAIDHIKRR